MGNKLRVKFKNVLNCSQLHTTEIEKLVRMIGKRYLVCLMMT